MLRSVVEWAQSSLTQIRIRHCSDRSLALVAQRCPNLEVLSIKSCPRVTDDSISRIALSCPKLRELDISYCYEITHESLVLIGRNCPNLKILKRNFMNWLDPSQHRGIVPDEYLNACPQDEESEAAAIANYMPGLEWLEIRFCKLSAKGLNSICQGCPNLEFLDLSGCANLTSRDIANASSSLVHLKEIKKPNFYIPRSVFHTERYGHWRLYDERFQTDIFQI
ncbi:F-box protein SKIP1 [Spatholobus suberectus]|nr:F-box protein SKIP1 [Spatholobus suberectus]